MKVVHSAMLLVALMCIIYGATAADTIGGLNFFACMLACAISVIGVVICAGSGIASFTTKRAFPVLNLLIMLFHVGVGMSAIVVLLTRDFRMGYGP